MREEDEADEFRPEDGEFPLSLRASSHKVIFKGALLITKYHNTIHRLDY